MHIPELKIMLTLNIEAIQDNYVAADRKRKPPYDIYSEYRDFIRTLLEDSSRYEILGYKPSDINRQDRARLGDINELRTLPKDEYKEHIDNYLKTSPISQSFYIATNVKNDKGNVVCRWIIDIRISNHKDTDNYNTKEQRSSKHTYFGNMYNNGDMDYTLVPLRFVLSCSVYSVGNTNYFVNLVNLSKHQTVKGTLHEVMVATQTYLDNIWNICNSTDPNDLSDLDVITSSTDYSRYDKSDIAAILSEIEQELNITNQELVDRNFTWDLSNYVWYALFLDIDDDDYVVGIHIKNNQGEDFYVNYDFDIYQYLEDDKYQQEVIQEIATCIFDEYIV